MNWFIKYLLDQPHNPPRCETCVHWGTPETYVGRRYADCGLVESVASRVNVYEFMQTREDFGCIQHEVKP